jgi:hypothetical protein
MLFLSKADGSSQQTLGKIVSIPQVCRASRPGGSVPVSNPLLAHFTPPSYGTPEWIKEINYIDPAMSPTDADVTAARKALGYHRITNSQYAIGCGHMSKNVAITTLLKSNNNVWSEKPFTNNSQDMFNSLVAAPPTATAGVPFVASAIWICETEWDTSATVIKNLLATIAARPLPISICP